MDLWNNAIGRKYGKKAKDRKELLKLIHEALKNDELIIDPGDMRKYEGNKSDPINMSKPIVVLKEDKNGRNELFFDLVKNIPPIEKNLLEQLRREAIPIIRLKTFMEYQLQCKIQTGDKQIISVNF